MLPRPKLRLPVKLLTLLPVPKLPWEPLADSPPKLRDPLKLPPVVRPPLEIPRVPPKLPL